MNDADTGIEQDLALEQQQALQLAGLFGDDTVEQAGLIDIASLNFTDEITRAIADGVKQLKQLRGRPDAQRGYIDSLAPGSRLLLCMWVRDMGLAGTILGN